MKTQLGVLFSIFVFTVSNAQIGFQENIIIDNADGTNGAADVYSADIDGDGDKDLISASFLDNKIAWYENLDGQGNFGSQNVITTNAEGANSVFAADLDGDGDMDVLSSSYLYNDNKVAWYENIDGLGTFGPQQIFPLGSYGNTIRTRSVVAADLDGDNDRDVIATSYDQISWFENLDGQGLFDEKNPIGGADEPTSVSIHDIDGDGDNDILVSDYSSVKWFKNEGNDNFVREWITLNVTNANSAYATDLDGDGDLDVISASNDSIVAWYENFNGLFGAQQIISTNTSGASSVYTSDIDGDGDNDIAVAASEAILLYKNDANGNFSQTTITTDVNTGKSVFITDLDGDGDLDITSASFIDDKIAWYKNLDGLGNFGTQLLVSDSQGANGAYYASSADIDADGDLDIISTSQNDSKIAWYKNLDGNGTFGMQQVISTTVNGASIACIEDIDGDGYPDIVGGSFTSGKLAWFKNNDGQGNFDPQQIIATDLPGINSLSAIDIDGDADLDLLVSSEFYSSKLAWYENLDGAGTFGPEHTLENGIGLGYFAQPADLDGDGDLDIIGIGRSNGTLAWYENENGSGSFIEHNLGNTWYDYRIYPADKEGDGDIDFIASNWMHLAWYINLDGFGNFSQPQPIDLYDNFYLSIVFSDIDNDGDEDIISGDPSYNNQLLFWRENTDGQGNFGPENTISTINTLTSINIGDINNDGDMDILISAEGDDKIAWFENTGPLKIEENIFKDISIYPNPTNGIINIQSKEIISSVVFYNQLGQLILEESNVEGINRVNIEKLNEGIYFVKLKTFNAEVIIKKLVKK